MKLFISKQKFRSQADLYIYHNYVSCVTTLKQKKLKTIVKDKENVPTYHDRSNSARGLIKH